MKNWTRLAGGLLAMLVLLTGCTTTPPAEPSPSPTLLPTATATATATIAPTAAPTPTPEATAALSVRPVGDNVKLIAASKDIAEPPYLDAGDQMIFPLVAVAEALGWKVSATNSTTGAAATPGATPGGAADAQQATITFTKGTTTVTMACQLPANTTLPGMTGEPNATATADAATGATTGAAANPQVEQATQITVQKGTERLDVEPTCYVVNGLLYVSEAFIDTALQTITANYDGQTTVTITAS